MNRTTTIAPELYRGYLTIVLDGIRTERTGFTPLPTRALTASETHEAMTTARARQDGYPHLRRPRLDRPTDPVQLDARSRRPWPCC
jgi:hypothetical protein